MYLRMRNNKGIPNTELQHGGSGDERHTKTHRIYRDAERIT